MLPDWTYDVAQWLYRTMSGASDPGDILAGMALSLVFAPLLILVHEVGHAVAVLARGLPLRQLKVGHTTRFAVDVGPLRIELGGLTNTSPVGGFVTYEDTGASPMDVLVIALAGPAASLVGAVCTGALANAWWGHGTLTFTLVLLTFGGLWMTVGNLRPRRLPGGPAGGTDGLWAQLALAELRRQRGAVDRRAPAPDPNAATSVAPPTSGRH